jgi:hypothetical protein
MQANYTGLTFASNIAAYQWGLAKLLPGCSPSEVYSAGHSYTDAVETVYLGNDLSIDIGLDLAVARRMFVFNLSPDTAKYPAHAAQWEAVVTAVSTVTIPTL